LIGSARLVAGRSHVGGAGRFGMRSFCKVLAIILILASFTSCRQPDSQQPGKDTTPAFSPESSHGPFDLVTRGDLAVIIVKAAYGDPPAGYCKDRGPFLDVGPDMLSCPYIKKLKEVESARGIKTGFSDDSFRPGGFVSKEEFAAFLIRTKEGDPTPGICKSGSPFSDVPSDRWSCGYIKRLADTGLLKGGGKYYPFDTVTYAQVEKITGKLFAKD